MVNPRTWGSWSPGCSARTSRALDHPASTIPTNPMFMYVAGARVCGTAGWGRAAVSGRALVLSVVWAEAVALKNSATVPTTRLNGFMAALGPPGCHGDRPRHHGADAVHPRVFFQDQAGGALGRLVACGVAELS